MTSVIDLAQLSRAIYTGDTASGWSLVQLRAAWRGLLSEGLQAGFYQGGGQNVVAFRGTNISLRVISAVQDVGADVGLGLGMNSNYFSAAQSFVEGLSVGRNVVLCGHSLGGAVAQVVGNRMGLPFVTFNAPGVAVWASRNMGEASYTATAVRTAGMLVSAAFHPIQALQDVAAAFDTVRGLNVCLDRDPVSKIGVHYGQKITIPSVSPSSNPLTQHGIDNVIASLQAYGAL
ncbi:MAG TPA: hypothetical protein VG939_13425 [Caulobacteraceae bacterium]|nr:hypothetical protein [Caulobacteraceae bacterium]